MARLRRSHTVWRHLSRLCAELPDQLVDHYEFHASCPEILHAPLRSPFLLRQGGGIVGFGEAVKTGLSKYATFKGRARRSEYWWFYLFLIIAYFVGIAIDIALGNEVPIFAFVVMAALLLPYLAVSIRRLHDTGRSGWSYLIAFIPLFGAIWFLVVTCRDSEPRDNEYGPWPKYTEQQLGTATAY